jgi:hypothetical protein
VKKMKPIALTGGLAVVAALVPAIACAAAQPLAGSFREGLWEMTIRTDVAGMKPMPPVVLKRCITTKEIQDLQAKASKPPGSEQCRVLDQKTQGNTSTWRIECTGKMAMKGDGSVTATGDTYAMQSTMVMTTPEGKAMEIRSSMSGKRLGDCKP